MKYAFIALLSFLLFSSYSQTAPGTWQNQIEGVYNADGTIRLLEDKIPEDEVPKYLNSSFQKGTITTIYGEKVELEKMRYNIFDDYIEFADGKEIKGLYFGGQIVQAEIGRDQLQFLKTDITQGTFLEVHSGENVWIYKKPTVKFVAERPGAGIIGGKSGNYMRSKDKYIIVQDGNQALLISTKKELKNAFERYAKGLSAPKKLNDTAMITLANQLDSID